MLKKDRKKHSPYLRIYTAYINSTDANKNKTPFVYMTAKIQK